MTKSARADAGAFSLPPARKPLKRQREARSAAVGLALGPLQLEASFRRFLALQGIQSEARGSVLRPPRNAKLLWRGHSCLLCRLSCQHAAIPSRAFVYGRPSPRMNAGPATYKAAPRSKRYRPGTLARESLGYARRMASSSLARRRRSVHGQGQEEES